MDTGIKKEKVADPDDMKVVEDKPGDTSGSSSEKGHDVKQDTGQTGTSVPDISKKSSKKLLEESDPIDQKSSHHSPNIAKQEVSGISSTDDNDDDSGLISQNSSRDSLVIPKHEASDILSKLHQSDEFIKLFEAVKEQDCIEALHLVSLEYPSFIIFAKEHFFSECFFQVRKVFYGIMLNHLIMEAAQKIVQVKDTELKMGFIQQMLNRHARRFDISSFCCICCKLEMLDVEAIAFAMKEYDVLHHLVFKECNIGNVDLEMLSWILMQTNISIETLMVLDDDLSPNSAVHLARLVKHSNVRYLELEWCKLNSESCEEFAKNAFGAKIETLAVSHDELSPNSAVHLARLVKHSNVRSLELRFCRLNSESWEKLAKNASGANMETVTVSNNDLSPNSAVHLARLVKHSNVRSLELHMLNSESWEELAKNASGANIDSLEVSYNKFDPNAMIHLGNLIKHWNVRSVKVSHCDLTAEHLEKWVQNTSDIKIDSLDVSYNDFDSIAMTHLGNLIKHWNVRSVRVSTCDLTAEHLEKWVQNTSDIKIDSLDVSWNEFDPNAMIHLGNLIKRWNVRSVTVSGCYLRSEHLEKWIQNTSNIKGLEELDIRYNSSLDGEGWKNVGKLIRLSGIPSLSADCYSSGDLGKIAGGMEDAKLNVLRLERVPGQTTATQVFLDLLPCIAETFELIGWDHDNTEQKQLQKKLDQLWPKSPRILLKKYGGQVTASIESRFKKMETGTESPESSRTVDPTMALGIRGTHQEQEEKAVTMQKIHPKAFLAGDAMSDLEEVTESPAAETLSEKGESALDKKQSQDGKPLEWKKVHPKTKKAFVGGESLELDEDIELDRYCFYRYRCRTDSSFFSPPIADTDNR